MTEIRCRARVTEECHAVRGVPAELIYKDGEVQEDDGTYLPETDTVVCTPCYMALGVPPNRELPAAIRAAHAAGRRVD